MIAEMLVDRAPVLAERLAAEFEAEGRRALAARGRFTVAIPGGSVAVHFFPRLAQIPFNWSAADFFWVDERAVPPSHPESNYGIASRLWLAPASVPAACIHRMNAEAASGERAAQEYATELKRLTGVPPRLDFVVLGIGPDGHVASLFPHHAVLGDQTQLVAFLNDAPLPPRQRMTLTLPVLSGAERVVLAALGQPKAFALREALERPDSSLPVAIVTRKARRPLFLMDPAAASLISAAR
jgi:6-phosphogluconolactonase